MRAPRRRTAVASYRAPAAVAMLQSGHWRGKPGQRRDTPGLTQVVAAEMGIAYGWPAYNHIIAQFRENAAPDPRCVRVPRQWPAIEVACNKSRRHAGLGRERRLPCNRRGILQNLDP